VSEDTKNRVGRIPL